MLTITSIHRTLHPRKFLPVVNCTVMVELYNQEYAVDMTDEIYAAIGKTFMQELARVYKLTKQKNS